MTVIRARKRPVEIQAMRLDGSHEVAVKVVEWMVGTDCWIVKTGVDDGSVFPDGTPLYGLELKTIESKGASVATASHGDYIIRGIKGEHYPCRADIFEATYEVLP